MAVSAYSASGILGHIPALSSAYILFQDATIRTSISFFDAGYKTRSVAHSPTEHMVHLLQISYQRILEEG